MPGLVPGIHVFLNGEGEKTRRGWPGQARPWRVNQAETAL